MTWRLGVAVGLSMIGLVIANQQEIRQVGASGSVLPYVLGGLAGICWGLYSALIARWREWSQSYATAPVGFLLVSLVGITGCLLTGEWHAIDARTWLAFGYLGLLPNATGYLLWELALHRASPMTLGLLGAATPVLSTLCLLALFAVTGQSRTLPAHWPALIFGALLVAAAVLLVSCKPSATADSTAADG